MASSSAVKILANTIKRLDKEPVEGFLARIPDESNMFRWEIFIEGPRDTPYEGGIFQLEMNFPQDYPMSPPQLRFISEFWHPNVYADGRVCISILHPPGDDLVSGETAAERWLPTQTVQTILLSVISMLNDPNCSSPANVDASVEWRNNRSAYVARCAELVKKSQASIPSDVVIPHPETNPAERRRAVDDDAFNLYDDYGGEDLDAFDDFGSEDPFPSDDDIWGFSDDGVDDEATVSDDEVEAELQVKKKRQKMDTSSDTDKTHHKDAASSSSGSKSSSSSHKKSGSSKKKSPSSYSSSSKRDKSKSSSSSSSSSKKKKSSSSTSSSKRRGAKA